MAYVDGYNLYHGLCAKGWRRYLWLGVVDMAERLLLPSQVLVGTKYFTTRVAAPAGSKQRQSVFLDALETIGDIDVIYGRWQKKERRCRSCGAKWVVHEEKDTDVSIAVEMLRDAVEDRYDTALLVSADSDLCPPVRAVQQLPKPKRVVVAFPPARQSLELAKLASAHLRIGRGVIAGAQLPATVQGQGATLTCPVEWT
jgi:NYN domain